MAKQYKKLEQLEFLSPSLVDSLKYCIEWIEENKEELVVYNIYVVQDNTNEGWGVDIYYKFVKETSNLVFEE